MQIQIQIQIQSSDSDTDSDIYLDLYSSEIHTHMTSDRRPWIADLEPRTADIGQLGSTAGVRKDCLNTFAYIHSTAKMYGPSFKNIVVTQVHNTMLHIGYNHFCEFSALFASSNLSGDRTACVHGVSKIGPQTIEFSRRPLKF